MMQFLVSVFVASTIGLSIGFLYPIERELDIAMYSSGDVQLNVPFPSDPNQTVEKHFRKSGIVFHKVTSAILAVNTAQESFGPIEAYIVQSPAETSVPFPNASILETIKPGRMDKFVDVSADIAKKSGIKPGQLIRLNWGELGIQEIPIRSIYGVRETGFMGVISISQSFLPKTFPEIGKKPTTALVTSEPKAIAPVLSDPKVQEVYKSDGYQVPVKYSSRVNQLIFAKSQSRASLGLILAVSILAGGALLGFIFRETGTLMLSLRKVSLPLMRIGFSASVVSWAFRSMAGFLGFTAAFIGAMTCRWLYQSRTLSAGFPTQIQFPLLATAFMIGLLVVLAANMMYSKLREKL